MGFNINNVVPAERRNIERKSLSGLMPGRMVHTTSGKVVSCRPMDVSSNGLGIISAAIMRVEDEMELTVGKKKIKMKVVWKKDDFVKDGLYRYGLMVIEPSIELDAIFEESGMFQGE